MKTIDKILSTKANAMGNAQIGRPQRGDVRDHSYEKIFDCEIKLDLGGYDRGGVYWGVGRQLRVSYTKSLSYVHFYRKEN